MLLLVCVPHTVEESLPDLLHLVLGDRRLRWEVGLEETNGLESGTGIAGGQLLRDRRPCWSYIRRSHGTERRSRTLDLVVMERRRRTRV